ncbi:energy-coupling factor transporter transmembrane component T [Magnetococcus marinus]|nr:energy-coupling factor transporter transmembrane component T [Magnetococcus marinus]
MKSFPQTKSRKGVAVPPAPQAGAKMVALLLLLGPVMGVPIWHPAWIAALLLMVLGWWWQRHALAQLGRLWWRMRWLLVGIVLLHSLFTPGHALVPWLGEALTGEGVVHGVSQALRLLLFAGLALLFVLTTPAMHILAGLAALVPHTGPLQHYAGRLVNLLGFTLLTAPRMAEMGEALQQALQLRQRREGAVSGRLARWMLHGQLLLGRILEDLPAQEEALMVRGYTQQLPLFVRTAAPWGGQEWRLLTLPVLVLLLAVLV